jgi:2-polyprenyl-3-methyl-5-hydroxy-6-metoxy-1,4-benzoquinol methylase
MGDSAYIHGTDPAEQSRLAAFNELINESFLGFLDLADATTILEVGSGLGVLTREVARRFPNSQVTGIELSESQLAQAREHSQPNLEFVQGDATQLPFAEVALDVVYCRWVLEHLANPAAALATKWQQTLRNCMSSSHTRVRQAGTAGSGQPVASHTVSVVQSPRIETLNFPRLLASDSGRSLTRR